MVELTKEEKRRCCAPSQGSHAYRCEYVIKPISVKEGRELIAKEHYSKSASNTAVYMHGLVRCSDGALVGAAQWLPGPTPGAAKTVEPVEWRRVLHLSRVAVKSGEPTNATSMLIGNSIQLIRQSNHQRRQQKKPTWKTLLTYADSRQKHKGTIYKATNWEFIGETAPERVWVDSKTGRQVSRKATKNMAADTMRALGYEYLGRFKKRKYCLRLSKK